MKLFLKNNAHELYSNVDEGQMLEALPSTLKSDISLHQYGKLIESTHFLKTMYIEQQEIVWSLVKYLQKLRLNMGSTIYSRNEIADNLYIIHKGEV